MIPNLEVFRPCDLVETGECWELALQNGDKPSVLALTRQNLPQLRRGGESLSAKGGYRLKGASAPRKVVIVATGSEVELAVKVQDVLEAEGVGVDVVSMPSMSRFLAQDDAYRADLLPGDVLKVSIEAGVTLGWERIVGSDGLTVGIDRFGASAPAGDLFKHFGFTVEAIVPQIKAKLAS